MRTQFDSVFSPHEYNPVCVVLWCVVLISICTCMLILQLLLVFFIEFRFIDPDFTKILWKKKPFKKKDFCERIVSCFHREIDHYKETLTHYKTFHSGNQQSPVGKCLFPKFCIGFSKLAKSLSSDSVHLQFMAAFSRSCLVIQHKLVNTPTPTPQNDVCVNVACVQLKRIQRPNTVFSFLDDDGLLKEI